MLIITNLPVADIALVTELIVDEVKRLSKNVSKGELTENSNRKINQWGLQSSK